MTRVSAAASGYKCRRGESGRNQDRSHAQLKSVTAPRRTAVWSLGPSLDGAIKIPLSGSGDYASRRTVFGRRCVRYTKQMPHSHTTTAQNGLGGGVA